MRPGDAAPLFRNLRTPIYAVHFIRNYLPLSLGMILGYARARLSPERFDLTVRFVASMDDIKSALQTTGPGVFLFSDYVWNVDEHLAASAWIKQHCPAAITVHGGPSVPGRADACDGFLRSHPDIDFAVRGEGEKTAVELLGHLADQDGLPASVPGLSFLDGDVLIQTAARERATDLDEFPSPYLTGVFDGIYQQAIYAVLETNRGCPYGCTFCDWGSATLQKIRSFSLDRVAEEVRWITEHRMRDINLADANFGMFERDVEICRMVCDAKRRTGFPQRLIVNYAKNTQQHVVEIVDMMASSGLVTSGTISIQTRDPDTLVAVRRRNIKTREYEKLQVAFKNLGLPLDTQLMLGLPGSSVASFERDLRYYFFEDVNVRVFSTVLLVNSPMADPEYRERYQIEIDDSGTVVSTSTISQAELQLCDRLARMFRCAHGYGMLRYLLDHLFWDFAIDPIEYLKNLLSDVARDPQGFAAQFPLLLELCTHDARNADEVSKLRCAPEDTGAKAQAVLPFQVIAATHIRFREQLRTQSRWRDFYREIEAYTCARYRLEPSSALTAAIAVQEALMPALGLGYPRIVSLPHDYVAYHRDRSDPAGPRRPLADYPPGSITVEDPLGLAEVGTYRQDWTLTDFWQLLSPLPGAGRSTLRRLVAELRKEDLETAPLDASAAPPGPPHAATPPPAVASLGSP
ncbi:MAG: radical SAM protein [Deltaproteobacteria bacterium]|nr:MAG: radical SAM protein [Deltaproteobacteria bacterium]TMQ24079.1 MAG: radical SAM protein [Deltaproteobacteria bacterium]